MSEIKQSFINEFQADNTIVDYVNGKAIVSNEWGNLFYVEMPEEHAVIGEVLPTEDLTSINELTEDERKYIIGRLTSEV